MSNEIGAPAGHRTPFALLRLIREKGIRETCRAVADRLREPALECYFERRLGITTTGLLSPAALGYDDPNCWECGPSRYGDIRRVFARLRVTPGKDAFLDFGSGKGRVVIMAARLPYSRVTGVELSPDVAEIARLNVLRARPRLTCDCVEITVADAGTFEISDDVTVAYLAAPFGGRILEAVLDNIQASLGRRPRAFRIVNYGPGVGNEAEARIRGRDWLRLQSEVRLQHHNRAWIHQNVRPCQRRSKI